MTPSASVRERLPVPWIGMAALVAATASGMLFFRIGGAPGAYAVLNGLTLVLALVIVAIPINRISDRTAARSVALCVAAIAATLVSGFDLEGVRRWLPIGPVRLHAAMLLLPAIVVLMPRLADRMQLAAVIALAVIFVLQPDFAAALALAAGFVFSRPARGERLVAGIGATAAIAATSITLLRPDPLVAVEFVEHVVPDAFAISPILGLLIGAALLLACIAPLLWRTANPGATRAFAAVMGGFVFASIIGAYPVPLGGYGASPILGYAIALALLRPPIVPRKTGC